MFYEQIGKSHQPLENGPKGLYLAAVDDYLAFCEEVGKRPEKEYRGLFNVRIRPELHKRIAAEAMKRDMTMNAAVEQAIHAYGAPQWPLLRP